MVLPSSPVHNKITIHKGIKNCTYKSLETLILNKKRCPKFKKGDHVHVVYSNNSYCAAIISSIINDNGYVKYYCVKFPLGGWADICAYEENIYARDKNDYTSTDHIFKETIKLPILSLNFDKLNKVESDCCQICLSNEDENGGKDKYALNCGDGKHVFHKNCISDAFKIKQTCPTCRKEVDDSQFKIDGFRETTHTHYLSDDDEWLFDD